MSSINQRQPSSSGSSTITPSSKGSARNSDATLTLENHTGSTGPKRIWVGGLELVENPLQPGDIDGPGLGDWFSNPTKKSDNQSNN